MALEVPLEREAIEEPPDTAAAEPSSSRSEADVEHDHDDAILTVVALRESLGMDLGDVFVESENVV